MMYQALKDGRISRPVVLEIKLEVVSRPGVLFCAINAASSAAKASEDPSVIHFETVRANSQHSVAASERVFFQGEVLVPDCIPAHLIKIPKVDVLGKPLEFRGRLPDSFLVGCASSSEIGVRDAKPFSLAIPLHQIVAAGAGSSASEDPLVSLLEVQSTRKGKSTHETFATPKMLGTSCVFTQEQVACALGATGQVELTAQTAVAVATATASTPSPPLQAAPSVFAASAVGGVVAVLADGNCCFHLCAVFGDLMQDFNAVKSGSTACLPAKSAAARVRIMDNINEYIDLVKSTCVDESEVEGAILENFGELPSSFVPRVTKIGWASSTTSQRTPRRRRFK